MSLGFNLAGSLAAIDKWVQDMGSEDETEGEGHDTAASADDSDDEQDDYQRPTGRELLFSFGAAGVAGRRADKKEDIIGTRFFANCTFLMTIVFYFTLRCFDSQPIGH